jgi:hypothetical protein
MVVVTTVLLSNALYADTDTKLIKNVHVTAYAPSDDSFSGCTHIAFQGETEIVTAGNRLLFRSGSDSRFRESPIQSLVDAHSVVFNSIDKLFYATDTGNHRLITFADPAHRQTRVLATSLADIKLKRPHDIVFDESNGWLYSLNPDSSRVFRFQSANKQSSSLDLSEHLGYSRALSVVHGKLHVIGSSAGAVVEIVDFDKQQFRIHNSFGKKANAVAGSWQATGLVLNDVDFFKGHWYATCYFCPTYAGNHDYDENKFIRFKTWRDMKEGTWDDLSQFLPSKVVPYFLTPHNNALYVAVFNHEDRGVGDKVYRLTTDD